MNSVLFLFNKCTKSIFLILAAGFWPKNLAFAQKMIALPQILEGKEPQN